MWRNWAGDQQCVPSTIARPHTLEELRQAIQRARSEGSRVRVAGSGHSFTDIACTDGLMLRMEGMGRLLEVDHATGLVKVEAGIRLSRLSDELDGQGLALENMGDIDVQTLAGAISTGTHGTGARLGNLSTQIEAMEMVLADGTVMECSRQSEPETLRALRVGLGSLGVISAVTLRCVPAFTLRRHDHPLSLDETLERLDELVDANDHFEFYTFPHSDIALVRETQRVEEAPTPAGRLQGYLQDVLLENHVIHAFAALGRRLPSQIPRINRSISSFLASSVKKDRSHHVFASKRLVRFTEMEYGIPRAAATDAVRQVLDVIDRRGFAVGFPIEVRFVAADDAYLSPSSGRDTCYIAVHMYRGMEWHPYFQAVEAIMDSYEGRPHWGKRHFQSAATLAPRYPGWEPFQEVRRRLDPEGMFQNEYTERVLGTVAASAPGGGAAPSRPSAVASGIGREK